MINLLDLPLSERVGQRDKMFIDIAMVEAEQFAINGVRGGQKSRNKKDDIGHFSGLYGTMYGSIARMLCGDIDNGHKDARIIDIETSSYQMSNVSDLMHELGKAPETNSTYTVRNRMIGEISKNRSLRMFAIVSNQVHHVQMTPSYSLGGVDFLPSSGSFIPTRGSVGPASPLTAILSLGCRTPPDRSGS